MEKIKILFVCLGNICRSPLAHEVFQDMVNKNGVTDKFEIESGGTEDYHVGDLPDPRMMNEARKHGIEMTHRGRTLSDDDFEYFDMILPMDLSNMAYLQNRSMPEYKDKIKLFRTFDPETLDEMAEVPDPYYGGSEGFTNVYEMVERTCETLLEYLL